MQQSRVLQHLPADSQAAAAHFAGLLACETDPADVMADMQAAGAADRAGFVFADVRSADAYAQEHARGAVSMPHTDITEALLQTYAPDVVFVVYCWGPGCNGAAKAALRLAQLGRPVKLLQGGLEYWKREGGPLEGRDVLKG